MTNPRSPESNLNRLLKWRTVFTGWQLGTRAKGDPEGDAVRDHRELSMVMRVEITALTKLLLDKGVFTGEEFTDAIEEEADLLEKGYQERFPGFRATVFGMDIDMSKAMHTMKGWKP